MSNGNKKGSSFERKICKQLSLWWTDGERDDVFWRSSQSGGRATQRAKKGKTTYGSYGDIAAVDPYGEPLLKLFTIELKRGRSHGTPDDLIRSGKSKVLRPFEKTLVQTITSAQAAKSRGWMVISQLDRKLPMVYLEATVVREVGMLSDVWVCPSVRYVLRVDHPCAGGRVRFIGLLLEDFFRYVTPKRLIQASKSI